MSSWRKRRFWALAFCMVLSAGISNSSHAEDPQHPKIEIKAENGQPVTLVTSDGREALLKIDMVDSEPMQSDLSVVDNTCTNRIKMTCALAMQIRRVWLSFIWTKNPDASRIGQIVTYGYFNMSYDSQGKQTASQFQFSGNLENDTAFFGLAKTKLDAGLMKQQLRCNDFTWLPGATQEAPQRLHIMSWNAEDNQQNPETGFNENRTIGGAYEIELSRLNPQTLEIQSVGAFVGTLSQTPILNAGANLNLSLAKANGDVCQVGLAGKGLADLIANYDKLGKVRQPIEQRQTVMSDDPILNVDGLKSILSDWASQFHAENAGVL